MNLLIISTVFSGEHLTFIINAISGEHILLLVAAVVLLFGGKKIPEMMGGIGKGMKEFKKNMKEDEAEPKETPKEDKPTEIKE